MKNKITVIVPATSANCGPGYDSLGLACNLYNDFTFEILDTPGFALEVIGEGEDRLRAGGRNLAFLSFLKVWNEVRGTRIGLKVTMQNRIPLSRAVHLRTDSRCGAGTSDGSRGKCLCIHDRTYDGKFYCGSPDGNALAGCQCQGRCGRMDIFPDDTGSWDCADVEVFV